MLLVNEVCVPNTILEKFTFHYFSLRHPLGSQSNLYVARSNLNLGSSFEKIFQASSSQCFIPTFKVPSHSVLRKKSFKRFLLYMNLVAALGQQAGTIWTNFCSPSPKDKYKIWFQLAYWPTGFWWKHLWKCWRTKDNGKMATCLDYKLTFESWAQVS